MDEKMLQQLRDKFPKLWVEYPSQFYTFFTDSGMMNTAGHRAYTHIKQMRHLRMNRHESQKGPA